MVGHDSWLSVVPRVYAVLVTMLIIFFGQFALLLHFDVGDRVRRDEFFGTNDDPHIILIIIELTDC